MSPLEKPSRQWQTIAKQIIAEKDSRRLLRLVDELCNSLDQASLPQLQIESAPAEPSTRRSTLPDSPGRGLAPPRSVAKI